MLIDRQHFLALVVGLGSSLACGGNDAPSEPTTRSEAEPTSDGDEVVAGEDDSVARGVLSDYEPAAECVEWDATGECVGYAPD
ncbi:MAG: hypothetical protein KF901_14745 [Myxococcales bacterium]|nr:hypothetical protein [Myxococcales bacterium]